MAMKKARKTSDSEKLSISLSKTVYAWAQELAAAKGFDTNFSAYVADLIRRDQNRKLLWLAKQLKGWQTDLFTLDGDILNEIENRLYPEYDGATVTFENWGWNTPEGEIRYLPSRK